MNSVLFSKLQNFRGSLNASSLEREVIIDGLLASLLSQQNAFLLGAPGTGKSDLVRSICCGISGAKYFGYLLTPTTDPSELFGPVAVTKLLQDEYTRDVEGYLPDAHIAFTDELFRGSSAILNSMLTLLNERTFNNGKEVIATPIQSIIAATNTWPDEESLQAFADRFLFRPTVESLKTPVSKNLLDQWALGIQPRPAVGEHLTLEDLTALQKEAKSLPISDDFLDKFSTLWDLLAGKGIRISDRRRVQIIKFLRALAVVRGDDQLFPEHMHNSIVHIVYTSLEDQEEIIATLEQVVPSPDRLLNDAARATAAIMTAYLGHNDEFKRRGVNLADVSEHVAKLRKCHRDLQTVKNKVDELLDAENSRISLQTRAQGMKTLNRLESSMQTLAVSIADLTK